MRTNRIYGLCALQLIGLDFFFISVFEISVWSENTYSSGW